MPRDYYIREASDTDAVYYFWRSTVCYVARQMRYRLKTSAEARARVVEANEDDKHCENCDNELQENEGRITEDRDALLLCWSCYEQQEIVAEQMKARGAMDEDGFVVCGHCGEGGGDHATEDCPGVDEECPGDEDDYDYHECCDSGCKYKGHWYKKEANQN